MPIGHANLPDYGHQYVGCTFVYLPGMPTQKHELREDDLVLRAGDIVKVEATFRNWNGVDGLDMLYVENLSSTNDIHHTHVEPKDLGIIALMWGDDQDLGFQKKEVIP